MWDAASLGISQIGCSIHRSLSGCQILQSDDNCARNPPSLSHQKLKSLSSELSVGQIWVCKQTNQQKADSLRIKVEWTRQNLSARCPLLTKTPLPPGLWNVVCPCSKRSLPEEESRTMVDDGWRRPQWTLVAFLYKSIIQAESSRKQEWEIRDRNSTPFPSHFFMNSVQQINAQKRVR